MRCERIVSITLTVNDKNDTAELTVIWGSREGERRANQNIFNFSAQLRSLEIVHQMLYRSVLDDLINIRKPITDNKNRNIKIKLKLKTQTIQILHKHFTDHTLLVHSSQRVILCRENPNNKTVSQRIPCRLSASLVPPLPLHLPFQLLQKFQPYRLQ